MRVQSVRQDVGGVFHTPTAVSQRRRGGEQLRRNCLSSRSDDVELGIERGTATKLTLAGFTHGHRDCCPVLSCRQDWDEVAAPAAVSREFFAQHHSMAEVHGPGAGLLNNVSCATPIQTREGDRCPASPAAPRLVKAERSPFGLVDPPTRRCPAWRTVALPTWPRDEPNDRGGDTRISNGSAVNPVRARLAGPVRRRSAGIALDPRRVRGRRDGRNRGRCSV
jgi:hypothetical protein